MHGIANGTYVWSESVQVHMSWSEVCLPGCKMKEYIEAMSEHKLIV